MKKRQEILSRNFIYENEFIVEEDLERDSLCFCLFNL